MKKIFVSIFAIYSCFISNSNAIAQQEKKQEHMKYMHNQKFGPQHRMVLDQANKSAKYILSEIKLLKDRIKHLESENVSEKNLRIAKRELKIFSDYFEREGLVWMAGLIENLYLNNNQYNMRLQLKYTNYIKNYQKDCISYLKPIADRLKKYDF